MDLKIFTDHIEPEALTQVIRLANHPSFIGSPIRIMPDVHAGVGSTIGFTAQMNNSVIPNVIGVDIGCGMRMDCLGKVDIDFEKLDRIIHELIPAGFEVRDTSCCTFDFEQRLYCFNKLKNVDRLYKSYGTLGGGNHFIEIDEGADDFKYLIIHTGSRNLGKQVADIYQQIAIDSCKSDDVEIIKSIVASYKAAGRSSEISDKIKEYKQSKTTIPDELAYLTRMDYIRYLNDMSFGQLFAQGNREVIAKTIIKAMGWNSLGCFESVHNYIDKYDIIRKGAISARLNERLIIPLNMRDGCILGTGKGNSDWNQSAPHGAGRLMSRAEARRSINLKDFEDSMKGIYTTSVNTSTIDESPMAYKPIEYILPYIEDTVDVSEIIKPIYNFKAGD